MDYCYRCHNKTYWAPVNSTTCYRKTIHFLDWSDWFAIFLLLLSAFGVVLIFSISAIFTKNLSTPVVKASGGLTVCYIILLSHFFIFLSTVFFIGEPTEFKCRTRQALFGVSFALCISCILIKSLKILLAFSFDPKLQNFLKCAYKPITIVFICTGIQVIICTFWLIFRTPFVKQNFSIPRAIILECNEGSVVAFGIMLGYIAALAFICFICAFKGRKLPENYNEAKFITFGMLIYFIAWIVFIPVYVTTFGKYLPAVEIIVILISNYGILCCTFFPKCYIIIYKQETNTKSAFLKMIYTYSSKSVGSIAVSQISLDSKSSSSRITASDSCNAEKSSVNGNCHIQVPGQTPVKEKVVSKSAARTLSRKRLSSIWLGIAEVLEEEKPFSFRSLSFWYTQGKHTVQTILWWLFIARFERLSLEPQLLWGPPAFLPCLPPHPQPIHTNHQSQDHNALSQTQVSARPYFSQTSRQECMDSHSFSDVFSTQLLKELFFSPVSISQVKQSPLLLFVCQDKQAQSFCLHF